MPEPNDSQLVSRRRRRDYGSGGITFVSSRGYWQAVVMLRDGRRATRKVRSAEAAEIALGELLREHRDELGYSYLMPRPYRHGEREQRPRPGLSARLRFTILERDGFRCRYCGATALDDRLMVDHVLSVLDGGTDDLANLVTACATCNLGKGSRSLGREP